MNTVTILLVSGAVIGALWYVVTSLLICENLRRRGQKVSFFWLRLMAPWYASRYKEITKSEAGKPGPLFYHWVISINLALIFIISAIVVHYL